MAKRKYTLPTKHQLAERSIASWERPSHLLTPEQLQLRLILTWLAGYAACSNARRRRHRAKTN